jgi:5-methylcytosine-specific restriction enzyme A
MSDNSESLEISARQLREHPLCQYCAERAIVTPAKICAYDGDKLRSLCMQCHTVTKRHIEQFGYRLDVGLDGFPCDPRHPFNRGR